MDVQTVVRQYGFKVVFSTAVLVTLILSSLYSFLLFHTLAELFSIILAAAVFVLVWNFRNFYHNCFQLFIGTAYLAVSFIDLFHALTFPGLGIFTEINPDHTVHFWLAARFLQSGALLAAPLFLRRNDRIEWLLIVFGLIAVLLISLTFSAAYLPVMFEEGVGLTPAKIGAEYLIVLILTASIVFLIQNRKSIDRVVLHWLVLSILLTIASEVALTLYSETDLVPNVIGHFLKIVAYYLLYKAIIETEAGSIYVDMTRFRETEQALRASTAELRESEFAARRNLAELNSIYASAPIGLCFLDTQLRYQAINDALANLVELSPAEHLGKSFREVLPEETANQVEGFLRTVLQTRRPVLNQVISARVRASEPPQLGYWMTSYHPVVDEDGRVLGISCVVEDITERRRAEVALRWSERMLKLFVEYAPTAIAMLDRNMRYIAASRRYLAEYKIQADVVGRSHYEIFPEIPEHWKQIHRLALAGSTEKADEDLFPRADGTLDWVRWEIYPWYDLSGEIGGIIIFSEVITKRKRAEEELALAHASLQVYAKKLQHSNEELEQFAMVASHDLQEPLRKISFFGNELQQQFAELLPEDAQEYLRRLQNAVERMQVMIAGLLELSRVTTRGEAFTMTSLTSVVEEVVFDLEARTRASGGQVIVESLPAAEVDEIQMRRLFQNLIGNGLKFHKPDVPPVVRVTDLSNQQENPNRVVIAVQDNGIGFEAEYADRIFQPFQRLHGRSEYEGTGLGLAISKKIVDRHHGTIEVYSQPGEGTVFRVILPVQQPDS